METIQFIAYNLNLSVKALSVKKNQFGGATVTSFGSLGYEDVTAPLTRKIFENKIVTNSNDEKFLLSCSKRDNQKTHSQE